MTAEQQEHLTSELLHDYFAPSLTPEREREVEEHLAECPACAARARKVQRLMALLEPWNARNYGLAYWHTVLTKTLEGLGRGAKGAERSRRLAKWRSQVSQEQLAAFQLTLSGKGPAGAVNIAAFQPLQASPRGPTEPALITAEHSGVTRLRGGTAKMRGQRRQHVELKSEGELGIYVTDWPPTQPPPLVVIIPTEEPSQPRLEEMKKRPDGSGYAAHFKKLKPGKYLVAFEPANPAGK